MHKTRRWLWARDNLCEEELEHILIKLGSEISDMYCITDNNSLFLAAEPDDADIGFWGA